MKKIFRFLVILIAVTTVGCIRMGPDFVYTPPKMNKWYSHEIKLSDHTLHISVPRGDRLADKEPFAEFRDISDDSPAWNDYFSSDPTDSIIVGAMHWGWDSPGVYVGTVGVRIRILRNEVMDVTTNTTLEEILTARHKAYDDEYNEKNASPEYPFAWATRSMSPFKNYVRFREDGPIWLTEGNITHGGRSLPDRNEVFLTPLDDNHYIEVRLSGGRGKDETEADCYWRPIAEDLADKVMASITIDSPNGYHEMPLGLPYDGLVEPGTYRYFESISLRPEKEK